MKSLNEIDRSTLVEEILRKVATEEDTTVVDLPPLYDTVDPDALSTLVESSGEGPLTVEIEYCGYTVTVTSNEGLSSVRVTEEDSTPPNR